MKALAAAALLWLAIAGTAAAQPQRVLVLKSEGRADATILSRIDAAILQLARASANQITPGDITYADAAATVGCMPDDATCKDEVLTMLDVDELVITTVVLKPGGYGVAVRRVAKGGASREGQTFVPADKPEQLDAIALVFVGPPTSAATPAPAANPASTTPSPDAPPAISVTPAPAPLETAPVTAPLPPPTEITATPNPSVIVTAPVATDDAPPRRRRLQMLGMAGGGAMFLVGVIFWGSTKAVQEEINTSPTRTKDDLRRLQDLEAKGDAYATAGNILGVGGLILGGVSTYYFIKDRRERRTTTARITPTVLGDGAGIAVTFGGAP